MCAHLHLRLLLTHLTPVICLQAACIPFFLMLCCLLFLRRVGPRLQPGPRRGADEEPEGRGEPSVGGPAGGRAAQGDSSLEGAGLQEWRRPGETSGTLMGFFYFYKGRC